MKPKVIDFPLSRRRPRHFLRCRAPASGPHSPDEAASTRHEHRQLPRSDHWHHALGSATASASKANAQILRNLPPRPTATQRQPHRFTPKLRRRSVPVSHRTPPGSSVGALHCLRASPGEPEVTLSPLRYHYAHRAEIEAVVQGTTRDAALDTLCASIGAALATDRTLGGLCDWVEAKHRARSICLLMCRQPESSEPSPSSCTTRQPTPSPPPTPHTTGDPTLHARMERGRGWRLRSRPSAAPRPPRASGLCPSPAPRSARNSRSSRRSCSDRAAIPRPDQGRGDGRRRCRRPDRRRELRPLAEGRLRPAVTSGTTPKTHTFHPGPGPCRACRSRPRCRSWPRYAMYTGCVRRPAQLADGPLGIADRDSPARGAGRGGGAVSGVGTPTSLGLQRVGHFNGSISRNGVPLGNVVSAEITYANGLDRIETIRNDGRIEGQIQAWRPSPVGSRSASPKARWLIRPLRAPLRTGLRLVARGRGELHLHAHAVYPPPRIEIPGRRHPGQLRLAGGQAASPARMCTAVLVNSVSGYRPNDSPEPLP